MNLLWKINQSIRNIWLRAKTIKATWEKLFRNLINIRKHQGLINRCRLYLRMEMILGILKFNPQTMKILRILALSETKILYLRSKMATIVTEVWTSKWVKVVLSHLWCTNNRSEAKILVLKMVNQCKWKKKNRRCQISSEIKLNKEFIKRTSTRLWTVGSHRIFNSSQ